MAKTEVKHVRAGKVGFWEKRKLFAQLIWSLITAKAFFCVTMREKAREGDDIVTQNCMQSFGLSEPALVTVLAECLEVMVQAEEKKLQKKKFHGSLKDIPEDFLKNLKLNNIN